MKLGPVIQAITEEACNEAGCGDGKDGQIR